MNKEKSKKSKKVMIILGIIAGILSILVSKYLYDLDLIWSIGIGVILSIVIILTTVFHKEDKNKEEYKEKTKGFVKGLETQELKNTIEEQEKFIKIANKEYEKRKDRTISSIISEEFYGIIDYGFIIIFLGIIMLGAIPSYFNVNDEFLNPTLNMSVNESMEMATNIVMTTFHNLGTDKPFIWFWLFWFGVFMWLIYPIIKIGLAIFKKYKGGIK